MSRIEFLERAISIPDKKTGRWGRWTLNRVQRAIDAEREIRRAARIPERYATLKARKWGISTLWLGYAIEETTRNDHYHACIVADERPNANALLETGRIMRSKLPFALPAKYDNRNVIYFDDPIWSLIDVESAQAEDPCRSRTYRFIHATEPAIWKDPEKKAIAIENAVPDEPGTVISYEGTGYGMNWWHDFWWKAERGESAWKAFFFPWWYDRDFDYALALAEGEAEEILATLDAEEEELLRLGLAPSQLKWRRAKIRDTFRGNLDLFHQEFPSTPREAFLSSGRPAFAAEYVMRTIARRREPIWRGQIEILSYDSSGALDWRRSADPRGTLTLWSEPKRGRAYAMGADVGHGFQGGDPSCAIVVDAETCEEVACLYANPGAPDHQVISAKDFGRMCVALGQLFNNAWFLPEIEGPGLAALNAARDLHYPAIGRRESYDKVGQKQVEKLGWSTNHVTRPYLFAEIREHLALEDGAQFHDQRLADELMSIFLDAQNEECHPSGGHDDMVFAWGIALIARRLAAARGLIEEKRAESPQSYDERVWQELKSRHMQPVDEEEDAEYTLWLE
jgi:hypothetical protein